MPARAEIYVFFGMIACGKSLLGQQWAQRHNMRYYNSDVVRKELAGLEPTAKRSESLDQGIYTEEFTRKTYDALLVHAAQALAAGQSVVLDGSYQNRQERNKVRDLARAQNVRVYFVYCTCPDEVVKQRLALRAQDPAAVSDGHLDIYLSQKQRFEPPAELTLQELITISTDAPVEVLLERLENQ